MENTNPVAFQQLHIAGWNEKDPIKRRQLLEQIYADDIIMYDSTAEFKGLDSIIDFIGQLLKEDAMFAFTAVKPIEFLHNSARLIGQITTGGGILNSMDLFIFDNGKATRLYAYLEPVI